MKAHDLAAGAPLSPAVLAEHGVYTARHPTQPSVYREPIDALKRDRGYIEEDQVDLSPQTPNLEALCQRFVEEHSHDEDEVRFVLSGEGIFDIRSRQDAWMRVLVEPGDLIVVPAGRYHRFMLTDQRAIQCVRLFKDTAGWEPHYRPS